MDIDKQVRVLVKEELDKQLGEIRKKLSSISDSARAVDMSKAISMKFSHKCLPYPSQSNTRDGDAYLKNMQRMYVNCYEPVRRARPSDLTFFSSLSHS